MQNLLGGYEIDNSLTETLIGTTDSEVSATPKTIEHFVHTNLGFGSSAKIKADGSTVLRVYYLRCKYTVTVNGNGGVLTSGKATQQVVYGDVCTAPVFEREGYTLDSFDFDFSTPIESDLTVNAIWTPIEEPAGGLPIIATVGIIIGSVAIITIVIVTAVVLIKRKRTIGN